MNASVQPSIHHPNPRRPHHDQHRPPRSSLLGVLHRLGIDTRYLLLGFPIGVASFVGLVTGLSLGVGLLITVLGLPILAGTLRLAGRFAVSERAQVAGVLGSPAGESGYRTAPESSGASYRLRTVVTDPRRWREMVHGLVLLPAATLTWSLTITWWSLTLTGLSYPLRAWSLPQGPHTTGLGELVGLAGRGWDLGLTFGIGLLAAASLPWIMHRLAVAQAGLGRVLLSSPVGPVHPAPVQAPSRSWS